jgi:NAD(P)-dependent dehydrogenase (short-subunit alcohol dehydrogenase family)
MFTAEGAKVVCADITGKQDEVAANIGKAAIAVKANVAIESDVREMITAAEKQFGRLDILVNNAGFGGGLKPLHEQTSGHWDWVHSVNIKGVFLGMKYGITSMLKTGGGSIVNIASNVALIGMKGHSVYAAAKAGVVQMTKIAALDYALDNIRCNAVCPGTTWTGLVKQSAEHPEPPPGVAVLPGIPMNRWGLAREIAATALFLASDEAPYLTGAAIPVDGGYAVGFSGQGALNQGALNLPER